MTSTSSRLALAAAVWSLACTGFGLWWLLDPSAYVLDYATDEPSSLMMLVPPWIGAPLLLTLGVVGAGLAALLGRARAGTAGRRVLIAAGAALAVFFGVFAPDLQLLSFLGYAAAILGGPVLVGLLIAGTRRHPGNLVALLVLVVAVGVGVAAGEIGEPTLELLGNVRDGLARGGPRPLVLAFLVTGGLLFAALTVRSLGEPTADRVRSQERLQRWGRRATIVAALCPLPYGLIRMTWLTPWPLRLPTGDESMLDGGIRVFGLCLGLAAIGGAWLTLGLIARWGEVWPAWLPGLRGRPVPVPAAVVPASVVSVALCSASLGLVAISVRQGAPWLVLAIPAPLWGPALALATYAYYRRRTDSAPTDAELSRVRHDEAIGS